MQFAIGVHSALTHDACAAILLNKIMLKTRRKTTMMRVRFCKECRSPLKGGDQIVRKNKKEMLSLIEEMANALTNILEEFKKMIFTVNAELKETLKDLQAKK
jgi:hypothetical protein